MQIQLTEELGQTRINVRQKQISSIGPTGVVMAVLVLLILAWLIYFLIGKIQSNGSDMYAHILIVVSVFLLGELFILYDLACRHFNTVEFLITANGDIAVAQRPLPRWGMRAINKSKIRQFFIRRFLNQADNRKVEYVSLCMRLKNGTTKKLLFQGIEDYGSLRELETIIEQRLGIIEAPVRGEYRPGILAEQATPRGISNPLTGVAGSDTALSTDPPIMIDQRPWTTLFRKQYDWINGETEHFLVLGSGQERKYLYQDAAGKHSLLSPIPLAQQMELKLWAEPTQLHFSAASLVQLGQKKGQLFRFLQQHQPGIKCELTLLRTTSDAPIRGRIRVFRFEDMLEAYQDTPIELENHG